MPWRDPADQVKDSTVDQPGPGNMWAWVSNGYQWVHPNFFIYVLLKINTHFVITFTTPEG